MDLARAPRRAPLTARKKGSGYENEVRAEKRAWKREFTNMSTNILVPRGALAKSKTGNHKNMVKDIYVIRTITFVVANQMPFSYPEPFLRAVRRGALAKSKTGNHKNMVKDIYVIRTITFVVANQMPV